MSTLALFGGPRAVTAKPVSPAWPHYSPRAIATVAWMLHTGRVCSMGCSRVVKEAEERFAAYHGVHYALAVNSGTGALHCALAGCGVEPGDEVITSPYSWGATTGCILQHGAIPVFADVLPETGLLDPAKVAAKLTRRTKAILPVHLFGQPADMPALQAIAHKHGIKLLEDASQAHGAKIDGQLVGTLSDAAGFSCMGKKLLAATEMGMLLTNDRDVYDRALLLSQHVSRLQRPPTAHGGGVREEFTPYIDSLVYNYRPNDLNCILIVDQLPHLAEWNRARAANRDHLAALLDGIAFIRFPHYPVNVEPGYLLATMRYNEQQAGGVSRKTFIAAMAAEGVALQCYVPQPIPAWLRLQTDVAGIPSAPWLRHLREAGIRYDAAELPVCRELTEKRALQMVFTGYIKPEPKLMRQFADTFAKVAGNLPLLLDWQQRDRKVAA